MLYSTQNTVRTLLIIALCEGNVTVMLTNGSVQHEPVAANFRFPLPPYRKFNNNSTPTHVSNDYVIRIFIVYKIMEIICNLQYLIDLPWYSGVSQKRECQTMGH